MENEEKTDIYNVRENLGNNLYDIVNSESEIFLNLYKYSSGIFINEKIFHSREEAKKDGCITKDTYIGCVRLELLRD